MAAIKFSKQYIEPNPNEIDYWVDLSSNQYGGRMKYYNGFEWVDLVNPDGTHIDINDFYNKLQINQMLSQKASVDSVESKVDDDEVSDVIKNISFSQRGEDGVEMVMFKYDDTTVGIQLPIADNTKSGIITKDTFKNLDNQPQLQQLYSEMYTKLSEIRNNYQPKLRAGANIKIENNVISAVSKIGTDWNDIANKPDIYDKSQVDTMMSGVYKIKGSRRFEALPLYTNTVGDTYNITNDFSLHGKDYPLGTNVVWTENGWDALAGIFDTSELEEDIQEVKDNYLPLTGGRLNSGTDTPLVILGIDHSWIGFKNSKDTDLGWIGVLNSKLPSFYSDKSYKIWHEGNDGHESGLDADTLDGMHGYSYFKSIPLTDDSVDFNNLTESGAYMNAVGSISNYQNAPFTYGYLLVFNTGNGYAKSLQIATPHSGSEIKVRQFWADSWTPWKSLAFADDNVASATKLATPIKLWGASIDGTLDYGGSLTLMSNAAINGTTENGKVEHCLIPRWSDGKTYFNFGSTGLVVRNNNSDVKMVISPDGNVGIGTIDPTFALHVKSGAGNILCLDSSHTEGESSILFSNKTNNYWSAGMGIGGENSFGFWSSVIGHVLNMNSSGNVTIGNTDLAGTNDKLYVNGKVSFNGEIASGDLVDWYGVSWSEDSSDPTCTRIGNMALHRSLPIQSAMQGYLILRPIDFILPLTSNWEKSKYDGAHNNGANISSYSNSNVMVKIPEFWYIDDYEPSTKTHNLKISQTAKAGWCHHKEAYVGAYEGCINEGQYKSIKGKIPTVSVNRETIRTAARANGYEDEYKWNIYTYEEHRAICHLFLVEYATRNSQAPVNTTLTADGFKQGGLGSGCTTGTVKINGVDTHSFIPTGTTDSLGNGSGQVAYTIMLTDADGNELGTVTRYANRYRGIENPFGHIWKHVDDVVNIYNAETTYKTVYKCDKPEYFATNKNTKYKPLCSFPGGTKMTGYAKEIKATINCDFFKYSVGGSESTYWCDYNYDNDDTSEHCLLIGGGSVNGGGAGLFYFYLDDGVGASYVTFGSRLTYLPWAE